MILNRAQTESKSPFTPEQDAILEKVEARLSSGVTITRLHVVTGIGEVLLNKLVKREWLPDRRDRLDNDTTEAFDALGKWLTEIDETDQPPAKTKTYLKIFRLLAAAHGGQKMIAITGDVGVGKTIAAESYARKNPMTRNNPGALYIRFSRNDGRVNAAYEKIISRLSAIRKINKYKTSRLESIIEDAVMPGDMLILDEYSYLGDASVIARCLHEDTGIAIAVVGNQDFKRAVWDKKDSYAPLASDALRFEIPMTTEDDVDAWLSWANFTGDSKFRSTAVKLCCRPGSNGGLRTLAHLTSFIKDATLDVNAANLMDLARETGRA